MESVSNLERPAVRLTSRGRVLVTLVLAGAIFAVLTVTGGWSAASVESHTAGQNVLDPAVRVVVVSEGDTLWEIAAEIAEPGGTRDLVYRIQRLNELGSPGLQVGQRIVVPVA